ncbi:MAG: SusD/RagB family nutrient-binding outer membrane lipoprotein [Bacteroidetes bacterium]|nr:SusD/RagB family nutrient-binding outer membrane lipoprotein [Bacteroidota bacterium]
MINKFILSLLVVYGMSACDTTELQDLNIDPQSVNEIDLNFLFTHALLTTASGGPNDNRYIDWRTNMGYCSTLLQQMASIGSITRGGDIYTYNFETHDAPWEFGYGAVLKQTSNILEQTGEGGYAAGENLNLRQAARILQAFTFHRLTDYYGNIPYSESLQGKAGVFLPAFQSQQSIYADLIKELTEAGAAISASNPDEGFAFADIYFDGDIAKWKKFAASLRLRLAMRQSNVDASEVAGAVSAAASGGMMTNADNIFIQMAIGPSEWTNQNGISRAYYPGDGGNESFLSKTMIDFLKGTDPNTTADDDPRLMIFSGGIADWTAAAWTPKNVNPLEQEGLPNGSDNSDFPDLTVNLFSRLNFLLLQDDDPYQIMNAAETHFLLAEAYERGLATGNAQAEYEAGVRLAMTMYDVFDPSLARTDAQVDDYLAAYPYGGGGVGGGQSRLEQIGQQMWASKFMNWFDAWADWRRTGFPVLVPTAHPSSLTPGVIPRKLRIPTHEVATNGVNVTAGATQPHQDETTRVWWDGGS